MFCTKCGKEIQEEWKNCPNCGEILKDGNTEKQNHNTRTTVNLTRSRDEIKAELTNQALSSKNGVILIYGAGEVSKDMTSILNADEEMIAFYHAYRNSVMGWLKSLRMFRDYIACTSERCIYIERGRMLFSLVPFLKKTISIPYSEILNVVSDKRIGIFSGKLMIENKSKKLNFAMGNKTTAEELKDLLTSKKEL